MTSIFKEIEKIIGDLLVKESELPKEHVLNSLSLRGPELDKLIDEKVYLSYNLNDCVLLFEVSADSNLLDLSLPDKETDEIIKDIGLNVKTIIYGNCSLELANIIKARLESAEVREEFLSRSLYLYEVSNLSSLNEFKNNTVWPRTDFDISLNFETRITKIESGYQIESIRDPHVISVIIKNS